MARHGPVCAAADAAWCFLPPMRPGRPGDPDGQREKREEQRDQRRVEVLGKLEATGEQQEVPPLAAPTPPDESTGSGPTGDDAADADDDGDYDETEAEPQQEEAAAGSSVSSFFGFGDATPQVKPDPPAPPIAADAPSGSSFFGFFGGGDPEPPKAEEPPAVQPAQPPAAPCRRRSAAATAGRWPRARRGGRAGRET